MTILWAKATEPAVDGYFLYIWPFGETRPQFSRIFLSQNAQQSTVSHQVSDLIPGRLYQIEVEITPNSAVADYVLTTTQRTRKFVPTNN